MVFCCVPKCGTDSWKCKPSITFHDFPSNPDMAAKWVAQINYGVKCTPMWVPRGRAVICSKHFLQTDFKENTDALKPRCVPTIFGHKYIGEKALKKQTEKLSELTPEPSITRNPLIVKVVNPQPEPAIENDHDVVISAVHSQASISSSIPKDSKNDPFKIQTIFNRSVLSNNHMKTDDLKSSTRITSKHIVDPSNPLTHSSVNSSPQKFGAKRTIEGSPKPNARKRGKANNDLIEIGPNTFLKINPDIIKINKKLTPSGNTVLQFVMDSKVANNQSFDLLPKIVHGPVPDKTNTNLVKNKTGVQSTSSTESSKSINSIPKKQPNGSFQHVIGHLVDTHVCEDSCPGPNDGNDHADDDSSDNAAIGGDNNESQDVQNNSEIKQKNNVSNAGSSVLEKAPVLLTTKMPISHCFNDKPKYLSQLKSKTRIIANLKVKISAMQKKIEELEDRCIVQERQLSYSFIKKLKTIRKNSAKGDPSATYILEQIRCYLNGSKMRWSDTTLAQCSIWCRKAPYAYEYFKKADFFKLPCLNTVKRFMKKHPDINSIRAMLPNAQIDDNESSSDFDFDESDGEAKGSSEGENDEPVGCDVMTESFNPKKTKASENKIKLEEKNNTESSANAKGVVIPPAVENNASNSTKGSECTSVPLTIDDSNMEVQEIILQSGEIVQCYSNSGDGQYFIIPNVDQNFTGDHEYSVVQADSLPFILQNVETSEHPEQPLILIANATDQVQCTESQVKT